MRFTEIEHKFVVDPDFDVDGFGRVLAALGPTRQTSVRVDDRYFLTADGRAQRYIIRHRFDAELHELTIKSVSDDPEVRDEISLDLGRDAGDQAAAVDAFVARLGAVWTGTLQKDIRVWYFPDCEVVHYVASGGGRTVRCVEFEAKSPASVSAGLTVLARYEQATGFDRATRSHEFLVGLVFGAVDALR